MRARRLKLRNFRSVGSGEIGFPGNTVIVGGNYVLLLGRNPWFHHPDDRWPNTIDFEKTKAVRRAVRDIARALADA